MVDRRLLLLSAIFCKLLLLTFILTDLKVRNKHVYLWCKMGFKAGPLFLAWISTCVWFPLELRPFTLQILLTSSEVPQNHVIYPQPISVLPVLSKIIDDSLFHYLRLHKLIYESQPGFRANYSTETALIKITDMLLKNIDMNKINGLLLVDYRKAYDLVDHSILLVKMKCYGLDSATFSWFNSYLSGRKQYVYFQKFINNS